MGMPVRMRMLVRSHQLRLIPVVITAVAMLTGCVHARPSPPATPTACDWLRKPATRWFTPDQATRLVGRFRILSVDTAAGWSRRIDQTVISLRLPDSTERAAAGLPGPRRTDLQLVDASKPPLMIGRTPIRDVELDAGVLHLGSRDAMDASPTMFRIDRVWAGGFAGRWHNDQTGIGRAIDSAGHWLPNPGGYYCAVRID